MYACVFSCVYVCMYVHIYTPRYTHTWPPAMPFLFNPMPRLHRISQLSLSKVN